jgi:hypothetical protein
MNKINYTIVYSLIFALMSLYNTNLLADGAEVKISPEGTQSKEVKANDTIDLTATPSGFTPESPKDAPCPPWGSPKTEYTWYPGSLDISGDTTSSKLSVKCDNAKENKVSVKIKQTWTDANGNTSTTERTSSETRVAVIKIDFVSLKVDKRDEFGMHQKGLNDYWLGGSTIHAGVVKITPNTARDLVALSLYQTLNTLVNVPNTSNANKSMCDVDSAYNAYSSGGGINDGAENKKISSSDAPGPEDTISGWSKVYPDTATVDMNFNLYLQCKIGTNDASTFGKTTWSIHGTCAFDMTGKSYPKGETIGGTGSASKDPPSNPSGYK